MAVATGGASGAGGGGGGGGGSITVTPNTGLTGDGSSGSPLAGVDATVSTPGLYDPPKLNAVITAGGTLQDLVINPAAWTLNGDTDGGYEMVGVINMPAASAGFTYTFQPNALATNQLGQVSISTNATSIQASVTNLFIGSGTTNAGRLSFRIKFESKSGRVRPYECASLALDVTLGSPTGTARRAATGEWNAAATVVDATSRIHCDNAGGILTGSWVKIIRPMMGA